MRVRFHPSPLSGERLLRVPGDKSIAHRSLLLGAMASGTTTVSGLPDLSGDVGTTMGVLKECGVSFTHEKDRMVVKSSGVASWTEPNDVLNCENSGTTTRILTAILSSIPGLSACLTGDESLRKRPMARILEPLRDMGAMVFGRQDDRFLPLFVRGTKLRGGSFALPVASAQVKSGLLLAGLSANEPVTVIEPLGTRDHTERMLLAMGADVVVEGRSVRIAPSDALRPVHFNVPGDFSSAAFFLVLAACSNQLTVTVENVNLNETRIGLLRIMESMGADTTEDLSTSTPEPVGAVTVRPSRLKGGAVGGEVVPLAIDELPLLGILGHFSDEGVTLTDASELRKKESDRITQTVQILSAIGVHIEERPDGFRVTPGGKLRGARVDSAGDHRMAMLAAIMAALSPEPLELSGAECVAVSFASFFDLLSTLGVTTEPLPETYAAR